MLLISCNCVACSCSASIEIIGCKDHWIWHSNGEHEMPTNIFYSMWRSYVYVQHSQGTVIATWSSAFSIVRNSILVKHYILPYREGLSNAIGASDRIFFYIRPTMLQELESECSIFTHACFCYKHY